MGSEMCIRDRDKSGSPPPRKKHLLSKTYEQSHDDSHVDYSDKSDVVEVMLVTRDHLMRMKKAWHSINCLIFLVMRTKRVSH